MKTLLKEPLVHFLLIGAVLFGVYSLTGRSRAGAGNDNTIRVTAQDVEWLSGMWERQWQRPPTPKELRGVVHDYIVEQMMAREAVAMGLEENDTVVRRRLAQKMKFLVEDIATREPTEEELRKVFEENRDRFQTPGWISFTHIYFNPDKREGLAAADAKVVLADLTKSGGGGSTADLGDRFMLSDSYAHESKESVRNLFGEAFAESVFELTPGEWRGPIPSGYGVHLVRVTERQPGKPAEFEQVRDRVADYWRVQYEQDTNEEYVRALMEKYDVVGDEKVQPLLDQIRGGSQ